MPPNPLAVVKPLYKRLFNSKKSRATRPVEFHTTPAPWYGYGASNASHATLLAQMQGITEAAQRAIANRVASLGLEVKTERVTEKGTTENEVLDDHPLKYALDNPHPDFSRGQLMGLAARHVMTVGETYFLKVGNGLNYTVELHPLPPANVTPVFAGGVIVSFMVSPLCV